MIVSQKMVAEAEVMCQPSLPMLDLKYHLRGATNQEHALPIDVVASPSSSSSTSADISRFESVVSCSDTIKDAVIESSAAKFVPNIRSGSYADIGPRESMDDEHIRIDDLSAHMSSFFGCFIPRAFYAVFDGHGGPDAASYMKKNAIRLFLEDADLPQTSDIDAIFLEELENSHRKAFLLADIALANECSVSSSCGTTALTALILGRHLLVANAGDCRAVLCRKGVAVDMSQDHRPSSIPERLRVEELGGYINDGYLNDLSVTRALGDWNLKFPPGSASPLIAEPDVQQVVLTEDDEFLIIGCDGIWDVMSSQYAVSLVRRGLRKHDDPQQCAMELVMEALRLNTSDNLTVIVICFSSPSRVRLESSSPQRRWRSCSLSEEARRTLKSLLEGN
ncbi:probable protein phosphatase 2C 13 [Juglans microcarpa x Juglans regia]|uniref:probable protein phosphatase 2C 13 n=1 Tax=Juglans microcarpa x Juglans regia TaxID=2249226 RepID=UPI001B7E39CB|nr:probable protein phosphatase 2C 13 [Juglans microcarpa x Juglans regia]